MDLREDTFDAALQVSKAFYDCWSKYDRDSMEMRMLLGTVCRELDKLPYASRVKPEDFLRDARLKSLSTLVADLTLLRASCGSPGDPTEARKVITRAQAVLHKKGYVASTKVQQYSNQALEAATKAAPKDGENHTVEVKEEHVVHAAKPRQKGKGGKDKGAANKRVPGGGSAACKGEVSVKKKGR